jgi:hypothetical protein
MVSPLVAARRSIASITTLWPREKSIFTELWLWEKF